jgi:hypothetical protein
VFGDKRKFGLVSVRRQVQGSFFGPDFVWSRHGSSEVSDLKRMEDGFLVRVVELNTGCGLQYAAELTWCVRGREKLWQQGFAKSLFD